MKRHKSFQSFPVSVFVFRYNLRCCWVKKKLTSLCLMENIHWNTFPLWYQKNKFTTSQTRALDFSFILYKRKGFPVNRGYLFASSQRQIFSDCCKTVWRSSINDSRSQETLLKLCVLFIDKYHTAVTIITPVLCGRRDGVDWRRQAETVKIVSFCAGNEITKLQHLKTLLPLTCAFPFPYIYMIYSGYVCSL